MATAFTGILEMANVAGEEIFSRPTTNQKLNQTSRAIAVLARNSKNATARGFKVRDEG